MTRHALICFLLSPLAGSIVAYGGDTQALHPTRSQALSAAAERVVDFLYPLPAIEDGTFHILRGRSAEAAAQRLTKALARRGYTAARRQQAAILLHLTVKKVGEVGQIRVVPVRPSGEAMTLIHGTSRWLESPPRHHRRVGSRLYGSEDAARRGAFRVARIALADAGMARAGRRGRTLSTAVADQAASLTVAEVAREQFVERDDDGNCRVHLLVSFSPERLDALVRRASSAAGAKGRRQLVKWSLLGCGLLLLGAGYLWADGRTRGFLRGPLRIGAGLGVLALVYGVYVF